MTTNTRNPLHSLGTAIFLLGAALGFWLLIASAWGDLEARLFDSALGAEERLSTLKCPVLLTPSDVGQVTASIENPTDFERTVIVRARFTLGHRYLIREDREDFSLPAGESKDLEWVVFTEQAAFGRIVLVRIYQFSSFSIPSRTESCGIVVVNLPMFSGAQIFGASFIGSIAFMSIGMALRTKKKARLHSQENKINKGMIFLGVVLVMGVVISLLGSWLLSSAIVVMAVMIVIALLSFLSSTN